jgi:hypothetical protein
MVDRARRYIVDNGRIQTARGIQPIRRGNAPSARGPARCVPKALGKMEGRAGNERAKAEGQETFRRPRRCRSASSLESFFRLRRGFLPGEFIPGKSLADHLTHGKIKADGIGENFPGIVLSVVKPERLFINVPKQVERFNAYIGTADPALERLQKFSMPLVWT